MTFKQEFAPTIPNNSASRCREVFIVFSNNRSIRLDTVFARAIGLNNYQESDIDARETAQLAAFEFRKELLSIVALIKNLNIVPTELYQCLIDATNQLGTLALTTHSPEHGAALIDPRTQLVLGWAACLIATNNEPIDYDALGKLLNELLTVKKAMRTNSLPPETKILFDRLIESIEKNLIKAQMSGIHSLDRVVRETKNDIQEASDILRQESANLNESQKDTLSKVATSLENVGKIFTSVKEIGEVVAPYAPLALQMASKALGG